MSLRDSTGSSNPPNSPRGSTTSQSSGFLSSFFSRRNVTTPLPESPPSSLASPLEKPIQVSLGPIEASSISKVEIPIESPTDEQLPPAENGPAALSRLKDVKDVYSVAFGVFDRYYIAWEDTKGKQHQESNKLPTLLHDWLYPPSGATRHLPTLQVSFGSNDEFFASDKDDKISSPSASSKRLSMGRTNSQPTLITRDQSPGPPVSRLKRRSTIFNIQPPKEILSAPEPIIETPKEETLISHEPISQPPVSQPPISQAPISQAPSPVVAPIISNNESEDNPQISGSRLAGLRYRRNIPARPSRIQTTFANREPIQPMTVVPSQNLNISQNPVASRFISPQVQPPPAATSRTAAAEPLPEATFRITTAESPPKIQYQAPPPSQPSQIAPWPQYQPPYQPPRSPTLPSIPRTPQTVTAINLRPAPRTTGKTYVDTSCQTELEGHHLDAYYRQIFETIARQEAARFGSMGGDTYNLGSGLRRSSGW